VAILPAGWEDGELDRVLASFDTVVLMRIGPRMPEVVAAVARAGLLDRAVYVRRATMTDEVVERDLRRVQDERGDCFAMVVVARRARSGAMGGENLEVELEGLA
jgi:precorrin-2/cobalt-factor-2 C20-methyltransferase